jgi:aspartate aminotransferase
MSIIAKRLSVIKPSPTLAMAKKAADLNAAGIKVIGLAFGEPDFETPEFIKNGAIEAIHAGKTKYTSVDGTTELKKAICSKFKRDNNLEYTTNQITVGTGAKQVLFNALMATVDAGDEVIIPAPYWVSYPDMVAMAEGTTVIVECKQEDGLKLTAELLEKAITPKTKWVILNSPSNPSGSTYSFDEMKKITDVLLKHPHVYVMADDIYEHLLYDGFKFCTPAEVEPKLFDRTLTINGVSKSYAMTGWRIGYAGGSEEIIKAMAVIQSQSTSNPCSISQEAARVALDGDQSFLKEWAEIFATRRNIVIEILKQIPELEIATPEGAFYLFPKCDKLFGKKTPEGVVINDDTELCEYLLTKAKVACVPGAAFGLVGFFRISYATSVEVLEDACGKIVDAIKLLK